MPKQKVVFHHKSKNLISGTPFPMLVRKGGEWVRVATGIFDQKNQTIEVEFDPETDEGKLVLASVYRNRIQGVDAKTAHIENMGENVD